MSLNRDEWRSAGEWLQDIYRTELLRPEGLWIDGHPDFEGIAAWLLDTYMGARDRGTPVDQARADVLRQIRASDEWRQKHAGETTTTPRPGPGPSVEPESGRLRAQGLELVTEDGRPWFGVGVTAFPLGQTWLDRGEAGVAPFADWMVRSGVQFARTAGCYNGGIGRFIPSDYGARYIPGWRALGEYFRARKLRLKLTMYCDMQTPELASVDQAARWRELTEALAEYADVFIVDGGNEVDKNAVRWQELARPSLLASRGSPLSDGTPPWSEDAPPWDIFDAHDARNDTWPKAAKSVFEIQGGNTSPPQPPRDTFARPGGSDEMIGIGPHDEPGRTTNNPDDVFDYVAAPFGSYRVLHVRAFINQLDPAQIDPVTQACVDAGVSAARAVTAEWRRGEYTRGGFASFPLRDSPLDPPVNGEPLWWLRAYGRLQGDRALVTIQRPRPDRGLVIEAVDGWRIMERRGNRGSVVLVKQER